MAKAFSIAEFVDSGKTAQIDSRVQMIPLEEIRPNPANFYDTTNVDDLADSIRLSGLLHPLTVYRRGSEYVIISGHRRYKAMRQLYELSGFKEHKEIPCTVLPDPDDPIRERLMLIHANSTGRILTGAEIARQARELTEIFRELKKRGVELPGRIRDRVAEEMKLSTAKLAKVNAIDEHLSPPALRKAWNEKTLNESAAYEISKMPEKEQYAITEKFSAVDQEFRTLTAEKAKAIAAGRGDGIISPPEKPEKGGSGWKKVLPVENKPAERSWKRVFSEEPKEGALVQLLKRTNWGVAAYTCIYKDGAFYDDFWEAEPESDVEVTSTFFWTELPAWEDE